MVSPAKVADRATVNGNAAVTTVDLVLTGLTVGHFLIVRAAADNSGGSGAARTVAVTNQSGTPIDTATAQQFNQLNDPGVASAGTNLTVVVARITAASGTVRLTYSGSVVQACVAEQWSGIDPTTPVVGSPVGANGVASTNMASTADASVASGNCAYAATAVEGPAGDTFTKDADTTNGSWVALTKAGTTNATADTNQTVAGAYKIVTGTGAQTHNPTNSVARDSAGLILELGQLAAVTLTVADAAHGSTSDAVSLTQHHALAVADSTHRSTVDAPTLTAHVPAIALTVADAAHGHATDPVGLTQHHVITVSDAGHGHGADTPSLTQHNALAVADGAHGHSTETPALAQHHQLTVADAVHAHGTDALGLAQHHVLGVSDVAHGHTSASLALTQHHMLGPADAVHGHTTEGLTLTPHDPSGSSLTVSDATHGHAVNAPSGLAQHHVLVVAEAILRHTAEQVALEQHYLLAAAESVIQHAADQIAFAGHSTTLRVRRTGREPATAAAGLRPVATVQSRRPRRSFRGSE